MNNEIKFLGFDNAYWKKDPERFLELQKLLQHYPKHYNKILTFPKHNKQHLMQFIDECIPESHRGLKLTLGTRIFWLLNGMTDFPRCHECNKPIIKNVVNAKVGYKHHSNSVFLFCSKECHYKNKDVLSLGSIRQKETFSDHTRHQQIVDQRKQTLEQNYGSGVTLQSLGHKAILEKYGVTSPSKIPNICIKIKNTCKKKYGVENPFAAKEIKQRIKRTILQRYGVEFISQDPTIRKKIHETVMTKFGTYVNSQKYVYDGKSFDSGWELCYYIWLKDKHVDFKYPSEISFEYEVDGKLHHYHPDFIVNGNPIEIKGTQFLDENKKLTFPFTNGIPTTEKTHGERVSKAKYQCMIENNVKIISQEEITPCLQYIEQKFGVKNYLDFCRAFRKK